MALCLTCTTRGAVPDCQACAELTDHTEAIRERIRHAALTGTTTIINGDDARVLLRLIQRGE